MSYTDYISIGSLLMSILVLIYSYRTNTKKYELSDQYRKEILEWYKNVVLVIMEIKEKIACNLLDANIRCELLSKLSAYIEYGRFYFPNCQKNNEKGEAKPLAYRGYRNMTLTLLVNIYDAVLHPNSKCVENLGGIIKYIEDRQRWFTSIIYKIVDPYRWISRRSKLVDVVNIEDVPKTDYFSVAAKK